MTSFRCPATGQSMVALPQLAHEIDPVYGVPNKGLVGDAPWGVVDGWRRKKPEFWDTKKLHTPIKVTTLQVSVPGPGEPVRLNVENRYEFTNLFELTLRWQLGQDSGQLHPDIPPQQSGSVTIPVQ